ncbi:MAG: RICIN domain-containing protein [Herpetosiphonaceae bacterium]|nr:RICIN domain-containing protein [Herpetosiphonaceae bacterium]
MNRFSNKVFDVAFCGTTDGTNIQQWGWLDNDCQKWQFLTTTDGWLRIVNKNSGKVAAAPDPCQQPGASIELLTWTGTACQQFRLQPVGGVMLVNANSGKALDVAVCNGTGGAAIQQSARGSVSAMDVHTYGQCILHCD